MKRFSSIFNVLKRSCSLKTTKPIQRRGFPNDLTRKCENLNISSPLIKLNYPNIYTIC